MALKLTGSAPCRARAAAVFLARPTAVKTCHLSHAREPEPAVCRWRTAKSSGQGVTW